MKNLRYFLLSVVFVSCSNDDDSTPIPTTNFSNNNEIAVGPDQGNYDSSIQITDDFLVQDINVTIFNLTHSHLEEVVMTLISPNGSQALLNPRPAIGQGSYINAVFDSDVDNPIQEPNNPTMDTPITGTFSPEEDLSKLYNQSSQGQWTLRVTDLQDGDGGTLSGWGLDLGN